MKTAPSEKSVLDELLSDDSSSFQESEQRERLPYPAIRRLGTVDCPVCDHEVGVLEAKNGRPFISCSYCFCRIFYNGHQSQELLHRRMIPTPEPG